MFVIIFISLVSLTLSIDFNLCEIPTTNVKRVEWLDEILIETHNTLNKHKIISWAMFSTLLGIIRDKKTMSWTVDTDMMTFSDNITVLCDNTSAVYKELQSKGLRIYDCMDSFARVCKARFTPGKPKYIEDGNPVEARLDLYGASLREDGLYDVRFSECQWDLTKMFPLKKLVWENKTVLGPNNHHYCLQMAYDKTWNITMKYAVGKPEKCDNSGFE